MKAPNLFNGANGTHKQVTRKRWTIKEDAIISSYIDNCNERGINAVSSRGFTELRHNSLPHRNVSAIKARVYKHLAEQKQARQEAAAAEQAEEPRADNHTTLPHWTDRVMPEAFRQIIEKANARTEDKITTKLADIAQELRRDRRQLYAQNADLRAVAIVATVGMAIAVAAAILL